MRNRKLFLLFVPIAVVLIFIVLLQQSLQVSAGNSVESVDPSDLQSTEVRLQHSDESGLRFTLLTANARIDNGRVSIAGLENQIQTPGAPALPYYSTYIALPPEATAVVKINKQAATTHNVSSIQSAPYLQPFYEEWDEEVAFAPAILDAAERYQPDAAIYAADAFYPDAVYTLSDPMYARDLRLVELRLYPLRYNPASGMMEQITQLDVDIAFTGANWEKIRPSANNAAPSSAILNYEQGQQWRAFPDDLMVQETAVSIPVGVDAYKIEVNQDGIYEIDYAQLANAGMDVDNVNPQTFEMMYRGESVAYEFVGDADATFEAGEKVRFYGWTFDGPFSERQYITNNIFWLWANGTPTAIAPAANEAGMGYDVETAFEESVTTAPENYYFSAWTRDWGNFPNEPDAWYWDLVIQSTDLMTKSYPIQLPYPAATGPDAIVTVEMMSRDKPTAPSNFTYTVRSLVNNEVSYSEIEWRRLKNVNLTHTVSPSALTHLTNTVDLVFATDRTASVGDPLIYLNRITVAYLRELTAVDNQLIFGKQTAASSEFHVGGFTEGNPVNALVWDITNPRLPVAIAMEAANISGGSPYTYAIGRAHTTDARFIATTDSSVIQPVSVHKYAAPDIEPSGDGARWLAITHQDFMAQAAQLAAHRAQSDYGGLQTHIVDIEDIINQYGYGLPLPGAIRAYLSHAFSSWNVKPEYVVLIGDATVNPRNLSCAAQCPNWDKDAPSYLPTDLVFEDRYQGLIPSDHTYTLLSGNDLLPDLAIGRLPVETAVEAQSVVDKIITYEANQLNPEAWQENILFVADNADSGGNFHDANVEVANNLPANINSIQLWLPDNSQEETDAMREQMSGHINLTGVSILNYRGHGSIPYWASPSILDTSMIFWENDGKPVVILSADCLDGHFAWPGWTALSEEFLTRPFVGTAAHWSSTGLGFTSEHTTLLNGFYGGLYDDGLVEIGNAANNAKLFYANSSAYDQSEMYSFTLQGDPAMRMYIASSAVYLPLVVK